MAVGSQFARYINPLLAVLKNLGGSARSAEAKAAVAEHLQRGEPAATVIVQIGVETSRVEALELRGVLGRDRLVSGAARSHFDGSAGSAA